jgi:hypothetical protein
MATANPRRRIGLRRRVGNLANLDEAPFGAERTELRDG